MFPPCSQCSTILSKAFSKKQSELDRFVKPAQETPDSPFRGVYRKLVTTFLSDTLVALESHYHTRLDSLEQQVKTLNFSLLDLETAKAVALRWGKTNFGKKLSSQAIGNFYSMVKRLGSGLSSLPSNHSCPTSQSVALSVP